MAPATGLPLMSITLTASWNRARGHPDFDGAVLLGDSDLFNPGCEPIGLDRDDRRSGSQVSRVNSPRSFVVALGGPGVPRCSGPKMALAPLTGRPAASHDATRHRQPFLEDRHAVELCRRWAAVPLMMRMLDVRPDLGQVLRRDVQAPLALRVVLVDPSLKAELVFSDSVGGAWTWTVAPSIGRPDSSFTIPPMVVPGSNRNSFDAGRLIGCRSSSQRMWIGTRLGLRAVSQSLWTVTPGADSMAGCRLPR